MINVTITVPDELRAEMVQLSEVNWSQICRKAISQYIMQRKNPKPNLELDLNDSRLEYPYHPSGYPVLTISTRIHNKMDFEIVIDRIQLDVSFWKGNRTFSIDRRYDLNKQVIPGNSTINKQSYAVLHREKIDELQKTFDSSFRCKISCLVFVEGFKQPYHRNIKTKIPIDEWNTLVKYTLTKSRA